MFEQNILRAPSESKKQRETAGHEYRQETLKASLIRMFEVNAVGINGNCRDRNFGLIAKYAEAKCRKECSISDGDTELHHLGEMLGLLVFNCNNFAAKNELDCMLKKLRSDPSKVNVKSVFTLINTYWDCIGHLTYTMRVLMDLCKIGDFDDSADTRREFKNLCEQIAPTKI